MESLYIMTVRYCVEEMHEECSRCPLAYGNVCISGLLYLDDSDSRVKQVREWAREHPVKKEEK